MSEREHRESLLAQLELLDEKRLKAAEHILSKFYQKKVIERKFKIGDIIVKQKMVKPGGPMSKF